MGTIIAVANQKGGVGKTTTAVNLSAALGEMGKKTLLVDADPQGNSSSGVGIDRKHSRKTVYELLIGECGVEEILVHTDYQNLETAGEFSDKCVETAAKWAPVADRLWKESHGGCASCRQCGSHALS